MEARCNEVMIGLSELDTEHVQVLNVKHIIGVRNTRKGVCLNAESLEYPFWTSDSVAPVMRKLELAGVRLILEEA
jgi:hypothetical protein